MKSIMRKITGRQWLALALLFVWFLFVNSIWWQSFSEVTTIRTSRDEAGNPEVFERIEVHNTAFGWGPFEYLREDYQANSTQIHLGALWLNVGITIVGTAAVSIQCYRMLFLPLPAVAAAERVHGGN